MKNLFSSPSPRRIFAGALFLAFFTTSAVARPQSTTTSSAPVAVLSLQGVPNAGQVNAMLYRGGQPSHGGFEALKKLGITTIVNFRNETDEIEKERKSVEGLGMRYVSIPWSGAHKPTNEQVSAFLQLMSSATSGQKVFVHCKEGKDRTGTMVAAYRMTFDNWTPEKSISEMYAYHYHHFFLPHLQSYVENFPKQLASDPTLTAVLAAVRALAAATPAAPVH